MFTLCGYKYSLKYQDRKDFFIDLFSFNELMINEISFRKRTLLEINNKQNYKSRFSYVLNNYIENENSDKSQNGLLNNDEMDFIDNYFSMLGKSDSESQIKMLDTSKTIIKKYMDESTELAKKYTNLCVKLSFLFGLIAFLLII
jgi:hypothetical protein